MGLRWSPDGRRLSASFGEISGQQDVRVFETARVLGYKKIYLETAGVLKEAVRLYEKFGFEPTAEKHTPRCDQAYFLNLQE